MKNNIFKLTISQLKEIALLLQSRIETGLREDNTEIQCIPTYVYPTEKPLEGEALVLDLGGTNYRVAVVEFTPEEPVIHPNDGWKKDLSIMKQDGYTRTELFKELTDPICATKHDNIMPIGYCFSYPAESLPGGDARLLRWTKGVNIQEMIGQPIGQPLLAELNAHCSNRFSGIRVINDTVASLFAGLTDRSYDAYIGLIVGTGTNMATFIRSDKISKLPEEQKQQQNLVPVNLESGNFHPPYLTLIDDTVDAFSDSKGRQRFEKAVSGMYLGDILKAVFPFNEFEEKFDAQKLTTIMSYPDLHKRKYVQVARWIYKRSAQLVAASLAGLISLLVSHDPDIKRVCLIAEGSLFWSENRKGKNYQQIVMKELQTILSGLGIHEVEVHIKQMDNANLIGTAIAAKS